MKLGSILTTMALAIAASAVAQTPKVVAHRGFWATEGSAQNSITALLKADSIGCYGSEFDVWLTADDVLIVNHDPTINGNVIENTPSSVLLQKQLANGEPLPTLDSYLEAAKPLSLQLILEVKPHARADRENLAIDKIIKMVADKGLTERTTYISFSHNALTKLVYQANRPVYYLTSVPPEQLIPTFATGPDFNIGALKKHPEWLAAFKQANMPINVWTINDDEGLQWCLDNNVDFITTNHPERALQVINAK